MLKPVLAVLLVAGASLLAGGVRLQPDRAFSPGSVRLQPGPTPKEQDWAFDAHMPATAGGLVFGGGGDLALHAIDSATGAEVWRAPLPRLANRKPMTYRSRGGRQFIVIATGGGRGRVPHGVRDP